MHGNPFAAPAVAVGYEAWYETISQPADRLEKALLARLLAAFAHAHTMLEVGCVTGHFTRWFRFIGMAVKLRE